MTEASSYRGRSLTLCLALALVVLGACEAGGAPGDTLPPGVTAAPPTAPGASSSLPPLAPGSASSVAPGIPIDEALLRFLPEELAGLAIVRADDGVTEAATDPDVTRGVAAIAGALYVEPERGDFAFAALMRLRDGAMNEAFYRDWRETFDQGACSRAGGLLAQAETTIGGHETFVGTCRGGLHTYHVWLGNHALLVSVSSVGERGLGALLVDALPH